MATRAEQILARSRQVKDETDRRLIGEAEEKKNKEVERSRIESERLKAKQEQVILTFQKLGVKQIIDELHDAIPGSAVEVGDYSEGSSEPYYRLDLNLPERQHISIFYYLDRRKDKLEVYSKTRRLVKNDDTIEELIAQALADPGKYDPVGEKVLYLPYGW